MGTLDKPTAGTVRVTGLDVARMTDRELAALRAPGSGSCSSSSSSLSTRPCSATWPTGCCTPGSAAAERRRWPRRAGPGRAGAQGRRPADPAVGRERQRVAIARAVAGAPAGAAGRRATGNLDSATGDIHPEPAGGTQRARDDGHHHHPRPRGRRPHRRRIEMLDGRVIADTEFRSGRTDMTTTSPRPPPATRRLPGSVLRPGRPGQHRAAHPQAALRPVRPRHRDRHRARSSPSWAWPPRPRPGC